MGWKDLAELTSRDLRIDVMEGGGNALALVKLVEDINTLRVRMEKTQKILDNIKTITTSSQERSGSLNNSCPSVINRSCNLLEDGEVWQDASTTRVVQWEYFKEVREYVVSLSRNSTRNEQLHRFQELESLAASCVAPLPRVGDVPEELEKVITIASIKNVRREVERVLVEIEDRFLRFKVMECARVRRNLERVDEVTSILCWGASALETL
ncbi:hypothetical protein P691DRAFT_803246 [Macrolepiota fuliginosa MF-IS2]|uniref:Uncharacterized protein n=1 Tax=Macrolepiota fuliginosa MF-IS2 TaxID=1400762 RepID=A0A9P6C347_9AGAR|nr:hypothetical protein P691DRAFT_803246 [Macrolepiota fuliginosa MF-IS2]